MLASSSSRIRRWSPKAPPTWCARWSVDEVPLAWCGGDPAGGLGTSVEAIMAAIDRAWSDAGVAILVDLGGAETNSEMAVEMLGEPRSGKVVVCNAPIVEGAVMAATEASGGASLAEVQATAQELSPA